MLNIHKLQSGYELFTTLCIVEDSDLDGIYDHLTSTRGSFCKSECIIIVISGNCEHETGLLNDVLRKKNYHSFWAWFSITKLKIRALFTTFCKSFSK